MKCGRRLVSARVRLVCKLPPRFPNAPRGKRETTLRRSAFIARGRSERMVVCMLVPVASIARRPPYLPEDIPMEEWVTLWFARLSR